MAKLAKRLCFQELGDERGHLVVMEGADALPFEVKRVYYIYGTKQGVSRGFHAHLKLKQVLVAVKGSCVMLLDDGKNKEVVTLDDPSQAIMIDSLIWREMHDFSEDCVLLCLASEEYTESDYIRSYDDFKNIV